MKSAQLVLRHPTLVVVAFGLVLGCVESKDGPLTTEDPGFPADLIPPELADNDGDDLLNGFEDRDQDGVVDPGETDPNKVDSDGDGIPDGQEVQALACDRQNDRPIVVYDVPGADAMLMVDAQVSIHSMLRTQDNRAPGLVVADPDSDVAGVLIGKTPDRGVATPSAQRDLERRTSIASMGTILGQQTRAFTTAEGFAAEQATFQLELSGAIDARSFVNKLAGELLGEPVTGTLNAGGAPGARAVLKLLTIFRSSTHVVLMAGVSMSDQPADQSAIRLEEFTDGTNVARHESFTRHVCDGFVAEAKAAADIIFVVDDSGSMEDDQQAVREAAVAMEEILNAADVDFRLGVTRTRAREDTGISANRGQLEGSGMTSNLQEFKNTIVVGASGGWEPGLETGILALDRLMPRTPEGAQPDAHKLREGAATVIIHLSDERDQTVECTACGGCDTKEGEQDFCTGAGTQQIIDDFIGQYSARGATTFALVSDLPNGCRQPGTRDDFEPGQGYVEVANATGGQFGSICGDMTQNLRDVARVATGVASTYRLSTTPASASIKVAIGLPGQGRVVHRSRVNGFDYDPVHNTIVFFGDAKPKDGEEIVIGYRRWDWKHNPTRPLPHDPFDVPDGDGSITGDPDYPGSGTTNPGDPSSDPNAPEGDADGDGIPNYQDPGDADGDGIPDNIDPTPAGEPDPGNDGSLTPPYEGCDDCSTGTSCLPTLDTVECAPICGDQICEAGYICITESATCGLPDSPNPSEPPPTPPADSCGGCSGGTICDAQAGQCVPPCESSGCAAGFVCSAVTHLCEIPNF